MVLQEDACPGHGHYGLPDGAAARARRTPPEVEQGMRAARRPQGPVGLDAVDLLAARAMRSGRRIGLVTGLPGRRPGKWWTLRDWSLTC
jgi:hypothetical protein